MAHSRSILTLLNQIRSDHSLVLPDVQRDFVWVPDQIRALFDSIMRGYPFGSLLFWQTRFLEIPYREFVPDVVTGQPFQTKFKNSSQSLHMVLDGQQRLQSLYIGIYGSYDGKRLYFNVTSGPRSAAGSEDENGGKDYRFEFWKDDEGSRPKRLIRVSDIIAWNDRFEDDEIERVIRDVPLDGPDATLARQNLRRLRRVTTQNDLVPVELLDDEVTRSDQARSIDEIVDIFVRVNSGGTRLTRSDLMFSLIKAQSPAARGKFDELVRRVDPFGLLGIDKDFVIRGLLTVADAPPTYDVDNVKRHWDQMEAGFDRFGDALASAIDFCRAPDVGILSSSLLRPVATLFPVVYYLAKQKNGSVPDPRRRDLCSLLYFLLFNEFLSGRDPAARIRYLRDVLRRAQGDSLPVDELLGVVAARQKWHAITVTDEMLSWNKRLALNIVQPQVCRQTLSWQETAEVDHVFPQSVYRPLFGDLVDDIGNLAYLGKLRNIRKRAQEPAAYFADLTDDELRRDYLVSDKGLLRPERFPEFVAIRRAAILSAAQAFLDRGGGAIQPLATDEFPPESPLKDPPADADMSPA